MSVRGCLLAVAASSLVVMLTGCGDNKVKAERDSLLKQNNDYKKQVDADQAELAAVKTERDALRAGAGAATEPAAAGPSLGADVVDGGAVAAKGVGKATASHTGTRVHAGSTTFELSADVLFDSGKSTLKSTSKAALDKLVATLKSQHKGETLTVEGHTDSTPFKKTSGMTNEKLGLARAKAVTEYLASHGIARSTLTAVSMADKEPKSSTNPALNRRVTIIAAR